MDRVGCEEDLAMQMQQFYGYSLFHAPLATKRKNMSQSDRVSPSL